MSNTAPRRITHLLASPAEMGLRPRYSATPPKPKAPAIQRVEERQDVSLDGLRLPGYARPGLIHGLNG
jgi:hypothetical protein